MSRLLLALLLVPFTSVVGLHADESDKAKAVAEAQREMKDAIER
jgi:hypothetical protein